MAEVVVLDDGSEWTIPDGYTPKPRVPATCRSCKAIILWCLTRKGRPAPFNPDGTSHFATCPQANDWRSPR